MARLFFLTAFVLFIAAEAVFSCSHLPLENGYTGGGTLTVFKKTGADESLNLRIFNPPGWSKTDKRPVIVTVFGGGWQFCCVEQFEPYWKYFTEQGFVCVAPDYRLGQYMEERCIPDVKSAFRWVSSGTLFITCSRSRSISDKNWPCFSVNIFSSTAVM